MRDLRCQRIQCDEIWSFVGAKQKNVPEDKRGEWGDLWTWTAIDADTKLIVSFLVGPRITPNAWNLIWDLAARVINRPQITTDALAWYKCAIAEAFPDVDYATVTKIYAAEPTGRYSPPRFVGEKAEVITGSPNPRHISTCSLSARTLRSGCRCVDSRDSRTGSAREGCEPRARGRDSHLHYNFARPQNAARHSCDGCGNQRPCVVD